MKTNFFRALSLAATFTFCSSLFANDFSFGSIEKTYVKCTMNEKGERIPNYYIVVDGVARQIDVQTFAQIKKQNMEMKKNVSCDATPVKK